MKLRSGRSYSVNDEKVMNEVLDNEIVEVALILLELSQSKVEEKSAYKECCGTEFCKNWFEKCCHCADMREIDEKYIAYNNPELNDFEHVKREYYYCSGCK